MDEQNAIGRLRQGDMTGLEYLVSRYQVKAVHTAYLIIGDSSLAEDVVQNSFLRVAIKINQFDDRRMFHSWFFRIVVNDALKEAKRQKRTISLDKPADKVLDWMLSSVPNPEEMTELNELRQDVWHAIQWLSPEQRTVIVQRHFLEMNEAEMSHTLRRPPSTIKWWLHTARKRLKSLLATKRINL